MRDSGNLPISKRPFKSLARSMGIKEEMLLSSLKMRKKKGLIRRFGAVLDHRKIGLQANALVAWKVKKNNIDYAASVMVRLPQVSHCYYRMPYARWPYNLYTMVHAANRERISGFIKQITRKVNPDSYRILFTLKEFKKTRFFLK